ncbi:MAG: CapA family protein [Candidatus Cloacimonetes bacterium]|nr:CapA family protein [Candidatus Cloacimonadota bacterium]
MINITISGDFCITPDYISQDLIDDSVISFLGNRDLNILNLECPITSDLSKNKIEKTGPHLRTTKSIFNHFAKLNVHAVTLANNHILDYGQEGLANTINECYQHNIKFVGAGKNIVEAVKPLIIEVNDVRIAIINCCESEWSIVSENSGGANPLDIIDIVSQINYCKHQADFVILIIHGGNEYYHLPSPRMVKTYRFFAESGADAVIGHHTHCVGGNEIYRNVPIVYSLGNMLFTRANKNKVWYTGLIAELQLVKGEFIQLNLIPVKQDNSGFQLSLCQGIEKENVLSDLERNKDIIEDSTKLNNEWIDFVESRRNSINIFSPVNAIPGRYIRAIAARLGANRLLKKSRVLNPILNNIKCDAHRDLILEALSMEIKTL